MLRVLMLLVVIAGIGLLVVNGIKAKVKHDLAQPIVSSTVSPMPEGQKTKRVPASGNDTTSLFVPYWTLKGSDFSGDTYDKYLYFGISPTKNGINADENAYAQLASFVSSVPAGKEKHVVIRMLDSETNTAILRNNPLQKKVIGESISVAKEQGFDGIVLDLELSAIPFDSLIAQIREFNALFYDQTKAAGLSYSITIYGDTFYRLRPFDVKAIAQKTDEIYIMAYDFHKSRGNPGPNFPLKGEASYGYDIETMSEDFLQVTPDKKVTVVFGLFGYDWVTDAKGSATENGKPLSYNEIDSRFLNGCDYPACTIKRDVISEETQIRYTDESELTHVVWFEDMESVRAKQVYLRSRGINSFSFWANSYF